MNSSFSLFKQQITNPVKYRMFMLAKLPLAFFTGLKIISLSEEEAVVSVKQKWLNKNPFGSIYFAVLTMAAELSTGVLCMGNVYKRKPSVSMLVVKTEAAFYKKATGRILFTCTDGVAITNTIEEAITTGESRSYACKSIGKNEAGETVAEIIATWSFKAKSK